VKWAVLLGLLSVGVSPSLGSTQEPAPPELESEAARFCQYWNSGDPDGLGQMMLATGIRLRIPGEEHVSISVRQARAVLNDIMARNPEGEAEIIRVYQGGGGPTAGFAELRWLANPSGTRELVAHTVFVGFILADGAWTVSEIRVFP
jgi:hypothetical protein